jgi:SAM-dependent methyltransferase
MQSHHPPSPGRECPICASTTAATAVASIGDVSVFQCPTCRGDSFGREPAAAELDRAYNDFDAGQIARRNLAEYVKQSRHILESEISSASLSSPHGLAFFDYGCGGGHFVQAAKDLGMNAMGMELDPESVGSAVSRGLNVVRGSLPENEPDLGSRRFDVIKCMHVLEHTRRPREVLAALSRLLAPRGVLVLSVPDQGSVPAHIKMLIRKVGLKRNEWGFVQPPIHLHGFRTRTIESASTVAGLKPLRIAKTSPLDAGAFPTTPDYWKGLALQKLVYRIGKATGSGGHLTCTLQKT